MKRFSKLKKIVRKVSSDKISFNELTKMIIRQKNSVIDNALYNDREISFSNRTDREVLKVILQKKGKFRSKKELLYIKKFFSSFKIF